MLSRKEKRRRTDGSSQSTPSTSYLQNAATRLDTSGFGDVMELPLLRSIEIAIKRANSKITTKTLLFVRLESTEVLHLLGEETNSRYYERRVTYTRRKGILGREGSRYRDTQ
jgi:hypothetical protein